MRKGVFITLEGGEGVGKTTQIKTLSSALRERGYDVIETREPGGTPHGEAIRSLLSDPDLGPAWKPEAEAFLISGARTMHVQNVIAPALQDGKIVISDRYTDSTDVYQGHVQNLSGDFLKDLEQTATAAILPDLTFILDLPASEGLKRVQSRGARDHYDQQDEGFYENIRQGFLKQAEKYPDRCLVIDAARQEGDIAQQLLHAVLVKLEQAHV